MHTPKLFIQACLLHQFIIRDFEYAVTSDAYISTQGYDSIDSDHSYPQGDVYSGKQYIDHTPDNEAYKYVIKKDIAAKLIAIQHNVALFFIR